MWHQISLIRIWKSQNKMHMHLHIIYSFTNSSLRNYNAVYFKFRCKIKAMSLCHIFSWHGDKNWKWNLTSEIVHCGCICGSTYIIIYFRQVPVVHTNLSTLVLKKMLHLYAHSLDSYAVLIRTDQRTCQHLGELALHQRQLLNCLHISVDFCRLCASQWAFRVLRVQLLVPRAKPFIGHATDMSPMF